MLITNVIIKGQVWSVNINSDSEKKGCNILDKEIWVNGTTEEISDNLYRFMQIAVDYEYADDMEPEDTDVKYLCEKILMAFRLRI